MHGVGPAQVTQCGIRISVLGSEQAGSTSCGACMAWKGLGMVHGCSVVLQQRQKWLCAYTIGDVLSVQVRLVKVPPLPPTTCMTAHAAI